MEVKMQVPPEFEEHIKEEMLKTAVEAYKLAGKREALPEYMNMKQAGEYAGVSFNTLKKWIAMDLRVSNIAGMQRISKKAIDEFYLEHEI
ncbi:helix-turn-helix domain-containing protein [Pediococcus ethanolidurans]|uniref:helix-turn-helix domain-containing protein n=1 Tax=Pediococcus ethanolidurans TaxID=319653 RepID=UPI0021AA0453|nr:helix-turn-helix domain-containing protein [Pediococcus ethanolidurans]MCT4397329.1 DNA-binding protein [Pediococcus ethanolidurans]MCV3322704.1 helix-turn-helix domain-containing protein [Pediococcus ethanolidurans]